MIRRKKVFLFSAISALFVVSNQNAFALCATESQNHWSGATINYVSNATTYNGKPEAQVNSINTSSSSASQSIGSAVAPTAAGKGFSRAAAECGPNIFEYKKAVTQDFIAEIETAAESLPDLWKGALSRAGYKITISHTLFDSVPAARGLQVRGYKNSATWSQVFGMFDRRHRRVVMAQLAKQTEKAGAPMVALPDKATRAGILRHEFGHAIDDYLNYPSHSRTFAAAYAAGLERLSAKEKAILNYYLQAGPAGQEEMFAELFAAQHELACDQTADNLLREKFPEAMSVVVSVVGSSQV